MELDYKAIGKRIKIARIKKNLTQETVADRIGVTPQHVSNIETGNTSVSLTTLVAIANTLTVSVDELLVFCQVLFPEKSVGIPFFQQVIFPAFSGHYASLRMRACSIR